MRRAAALVLLLALGCSKTAPPQTPPPRGELRALYTQTPIAVDGRLDDPVWKNAPRYALSAAKDRSAPGTIEAGEFRFAWNEDEFYVGVRFEDRDLIARGEKDQLHHYKLGDLVEVFLKPEGQSWYWELYATPRGKKTSFWLPKHKKLTLRDCGLRVAAQCNGTLNDSGNRDQGWTAEMAMPMADLRSPGAEAPSESAWRVLVARYDYSEDRARPEFSMAPPLSRTDYHLLDEYGRLKLIR